MQALTSSPRFSSGTGTAAASTISARPQSTAYTSRAEIEIAACILPEEIAGAEPLAVESGLGRLRLVVITLQNSGTAHYQLADFAHRHGFAVGIGDARLAERRWHAARAGAHHVGCLDRHEKAGADLGHAKGLA